MRNNIAPKTSNMVITAIVGLIICVSVMIPIISSFYNISGEKEEYVNEQYNSYVGTYDKVDSFTIKNTTDVNGNIFNHPDNTTFNRLVFADSFYLTYKGSTSEWQIFGPDGSYKTGTDSLSVSAINGSATFSATSITDPLVIQYNYAFTYAGDVGGNYIPSSAMTHNGHIYVNSLDDIFGIFRYTHEGSNHMATLENQALSDKHRDIEGTVDIISTEIEKVYPATYDVTALTLESEGETISPVILIVPASVIVYDTTSIIPVLISIVPILAIVGLVVGLIVPFVIGKK